MSTWADCLQIWLPPWKTFSSSCQACNCYDGSGFRVGGKDCSVPFPWTCCFHAFFTCVGHCSYSYHLGLLMTGPLVLYFWLGEEQKKTLIDLLAVWPLVNKLTSVFIHLWNEHGNTSWLWNLRNEIDTWVWKVLGMIGVFIKTVLSIY